MAGIEKGDVEARTEIKGSEYWTKIMLMLLWVCWIGNIWYQVCHMNLNGDNNPLVCLQLVYNLFPLPLWMLSVVLLKGSMSLSQRTTVAES